MIDKVFSISGNKISSFIIDENSLKFSSKSFKTSAEFQEAWDKKLSLATKLEVKFDSIKSIKKEDNDDDILIKYKTFAGIHTDFEFSFSDNNDIVLFFNHFEKQLFYQKLNETLTPIKAIRNYLIGLTVAIVVTIFSYYQAIAIENGTAVEITSRKERLFRNIIGTLGDKGVILVGTAISIFLIFKIWTRFKNPPTQVRFLPPNQ